MGKFVETATWKGLPEEEMAMVNALIGPSLGISPRKETKERSKPKYQPVDPDKYVGKVTYFNPERGFGRVGGRTFLHLSYVIDENAAFLREGVWIAYNLGVDPRSGREIAIDIQLIEKGAN